MNEIRYTEASVTDGWTVGAYVDGAQVGFLMLQPREYTYGRESICDYAEITELFVIPAWRRKGVGAELLRRALAWAQAQKFERVAVEASAKAGTPGRPFYEAFGFTARSVVLDTAVTPEQAEALVKSELGGRA